MKKSTLQTLKNSILTGIFAIIFTLLGVLFASSWELPPTSTAEVMTPAAMGPPIPLVNDEGNSPFVQVARRMLPSVVHIKTTRQMEYDSGPFSRWFEFFDPRIPPDDRYHRDLPEVRNSGSGFIIDRTGYVLTNNHVVSGATEIMVVLADGNEILGEVIGTDPETDVALVKIDQELGDESVAPLGDSDGIQVGDWAIAIGNPFGLEQSLTVGVISAKGRVNLSISGGAPLYQNFIQTDASINFGNSGGPLVNIRGEVIGINTAINPAGQGIGFAIPINMARDIYRDLRETGAVTRGYLGMVPRELNPEMRAALNLDEETRGIFVDSVQEETPASEGELMPGDVILTWDGLQVESESQFRILVAKGRPGDRIDAEIVRNGKQRQLRFELGNRAEFDTSLREQPIEREPEDLFFGLAVAELDQRSIARFRLDEDIVRRRGGVVITGMLQDSPARGKLSVGDVITKIDLYAIEDLQDFHEASAELADREKATLFHVIRGNRTTLEAVTP